MKRRLFLTGAIGCGKSTAILTAIGPRLPGFGGFLTKRIRDENGRAVAFCLVSADGSREAVFLDCRSGKPELHPEVFDTMGVSLLQGPYLVLDEIGGVELLQPGFARALDALLESDIPILGVVKGEGAASAMIRRLGLAAEYESRAHALRRRLSEDDNTLFYPCALHDAHAPELCREWVEEYVHD